MGRLRLVSKKVLYTELLSNYDLIVIPCTSTMENTNKASFIIFNKVNIKLLKKYINKKYTLIKRMKVGDIRITPSFKLKSDLMFIRYPYFNNNECNKLLLNTYSTMLDIINKNEYKNVLCFSIENKIYDYKSNEICPKIYKLFKDYIIKKDINIDIIFNKKSEKKNYI